MHVRCFQVQHWVYDPCILTMLGVLSTVSIGTCVKLRRIDLKHKNKLWFSRAAKISCLDDCMWFYLRFAKDGKTSHHVNHPKILGHISLACNTAKLHKLKPEPALIKFKMWRQIKCNYVDAMQIYNVLYGFICIWKKKQIRMCVCVWGRLYKSSLEHLI